MNPVKNILCFHGYSTNANIMKIQMDNIISKNMLSYMVFNYNKENLYKLGNKHENINYKFYDGPIIVNDHVNDFNRLYGTNYEYLNSWFDFVNHVKYKNYLVDKNLIIKKSVINKRDYNNTYKKTINFIDEIIKCNSNVNCTIGFSSGIFPAKILLEKKVTNNGIFFSPQSYLDNSVFNKINNCNLLFIIGEKDEIRLNSFDLYCKLKKNNNVEIITFDGGHCIPNNKSQDVINSISNFIKKT
jgi:predicted esterase